MEEPAAIPLHTERLEAGDRILLYTDGITEGRAADGSQFGVERLIDFIVRHSHDGTPAPADDLRGCTAATKAMGEGSTQHQHLVQTEVPTRLLEEWLALWTAYHHIPDTLHVGLRPHTAGSELLELTLTNTSGEKEANIIFAVIADRRGRNILSVRAQEHRRQRAAHEAADDPHPPVPGAPIQDLGGPLRQPDR